MAAPPPTQNGVVSGALSILDARDAGGSSWTRSPLCKNPLARPLFAQRAPLHYNRCMALRPDQDAELRRLNVEGIRQQLTYAGPGRNAVVPGLGDGMMLRGDVEEHVAKRERKATRRLIWTNTALAIIGIVIAILAYYFRSTPTK
jgi:hypothetical protein